MNLAEASEKRIKYLYAPGWAEGVYIELDLIGENLHGPWVHLHQPNKEIVDVLWFEITGYKFEEYVS